MPDLIWTSLHRILGEKNYIYACPINRCANFQVLQNIGNIQIFVIIIFFTDLVI